MKKLGNIVEFICDKAIKMMILGIIGILGYWAAKYTYVYPADYSLERTVIEPDSLFKNLLAFGGALLLIYGLQALILRGTEEQKRKRVLILAIIDAAVVGGILVWYVANTHIPPYWDQAQVFLDALSFKAGDYSDMNGYLGMYPQQYGLTFLYEIMLLFGPDKYITIEYFNVLFILIIIFVGYLISDELFHNQTVNFYSLVGLTAFIPMYVYANFVYGDIASTAMVFLGIWAVLKWHKDGSMKYMIAAVVFFTVAYLFRKNVLIILIAVMLALFIDGFKRMNWKAAVLGILIMILPMMSMEGIKLSYEIRSGTEVSGGIPSVMWIAMGMQEDYKGCGVFNGYTESIYRGIGGSDSETTKQIGTEYIRNRLEEFKNNPEMAKNFYKSKIQNQWIEPTFSSLIMTSKFGDTPTELTLAVYYGKTAENLISFMDYYNFIIYAGVVCYALIALFKKDTIIKSTALIAVIGGFLFSIIWEAKGRYVMPYVILLLPYMAQGIFLMQTSLKKWTCKVIVSCNLKK